MGVGPNEIPNPAATASDISRIHGPLENSGRNPLLDWSGALSDTSRRLALEQHLLLERLDQVADAQLRGASTRWTSPNPTTATLRMSISVRRPASTSWEHRGLVLPIPDTARMAYAQAVQLGELQTLDPRDVGRLLSQGSNQSVGRIELRQLAPGNPVSAATALHATLAMSLRKWGCARRP